MKKLPTLGLVLVSVALATGCAAKEAAPSHASEVAPASPAIGGTSAATDGMTTAKGADRALIVTGEVYVSTRNVAMATERLRTEVERAGGYVSDVQESGSKEHRQAVLELRIPADKTRSLRAALADLGEITSDSEKVEDVTDARADLEARLHNARIEEERIKDILQLGSRAPRLPPRSSRLVRARSDVLFRCQGVAMKAIALVTLLFVAGCAKASERRSPETASRPTVR